LFQFSFSARNLHIILYSVKYLMIFTVSILFFPCDVPSCHPLALQRGYFYIVFLFVKKKGLVLFPYGSFLVSLRTERYSNDLILYWLVVLPAAFWKLGNFTRHRKTKWQSNISNPQGKESVFWVKVQDAESPTNIGLTNLLAGGSTMEGLN